MAIDLMWLWWFLVWRALLPAKKEKFADNPYYAYRDNGYIERLCARRLQWADERRAK